MSRHPQSLSTQAPEPAASSRRALVLGCLLAASALLGAGCGSSASSDSTEAADGLPAVVFTRATGTELIGETERRADADLYIVRDGASTPERLTSGADEDIDAAWSPDGATIYFTRSTQSEAGDLTSEIFEVDAAGGEPTQVTRCNPPRCESDSEPRVSPDGKALRFLRIGPDGVGILEMSLPDGTPRAMALPRAFKPFTSPSWRSADEVSLSGYSAGSKVEAFSGSPTLSELEPLPVCADEVDCATPGPISWAGAGAPATGVVEADGRNGDSAIFALENEPPADPIVGCLEKDQCPHRPSITSDGTAVVFDVGDDFGGDLYTADSSGDNIEQFTDGPELDCCAAFAPTDGS